MNLHKRGWTEGLKLEEFDELKHHNEDAVKVRSLFLSTYLSTQISSHRRALSSLEIVVSWPASKSKLIPPSLRFFPTSSSPNHNRTCSTSPPSTPLPSRRNLL